MGTGLDQAPKGRSGLPAARCGREPKAADAAVFSNEVGEPIRYFQRPWLAACNRRGTYGLRWHDLRHEYASRLVEHGVPLSQVRDLLGHASIVTTERYDNQKPEALMAAAKRLETGESFKNLSSSNADVDAKRADEEPKAQTSNPLSRSGEGGWGE